MRGSTAVRLLFFLLGRWGLQKNPSPPSQKKYMPDVCFVCFHCSPCKTMKNYRPKKQLFIYFFILRRPLGLAKNSSPIRGYFLRLFIKNLTPPLFFLSIVVYLKPPRRRRETNNRKMCWKSILFCIIWSFLFTFIYFHFGGGALGTIVKNSPK